MKVAKRVLALFVCVFIITSSIYASPLDYGIYGGISEGKKLPKTTEQLLNTTEQNTNFKTTYKEMIFLTGTPQTFEGTITVDAKDANLEEQGTYKASFNVGQSEATQEDVLIARNITYNVNYRKENNQTIKDYEVANWVETITVGGNEYQIDPIQSKSSISIIEDKTPGVTYYKGDVSHRGVYTFGEETVTQDIQGVLYGYNSAWSSTETQRLNCTITSGDWQMEYQIRPSVSINKVLEYSKNEPTAISFEGNYKEIMQNKSGLNYNIYVMPPQFAYTTPKSGNISIASFNTFEQLIAPDINYLKGHFAETDIKKMFAMEILDGDPKFYQPNQAITRGQFTEMLVKAIKLPITDMATLRGNEPLQIAFSDVMPEEEEYPFIMEAFNQKLVFGKTDGSFHIDEPIERQEAIVILLRTLGLEHLGLEPTPITPFVDDKYIASWAKKEIYAANRIGIIAGDIDGKFNPRSFISKAEAAAIINRLIDYMRMDMQIDYTENIVNYAD